MPKISIIVPVYNTSKYLTKCIDSLLNQTLSDIEIIIINDGSKDNSESIIKTYSDPRIRYYSQNNSGIGKTRNKGIKLATGEFLSFIDSDDYISPDFCEKMYEKAIQDKCDLVVCNFFLDKDNKLEEFKIKPFKDGSLKTSPNILYNINLGPCNKIYKRDLIINNNILFNEELKYEDVPFVCKSLKYASKIGKVEDFLTYYVIHSQSETTTRDETIFDIFKISDIVIDLFKDTSYLKEDLSKVIIRIIIDYMVQERYQKDLKVANKFIDEAYLYLKEFDPNWTKNLAFNDFSYPKSIIVKNKFLLKLYIRLYHLLR